MRPTYFLSDLHVGSAQHDGEAHLLRFLRSIRGHAEAVYLVGDSFDFWLGYRSAIFSSAFPLLRALADLIDSGTQVTLFSGNHDPDLVNSLTRWAFRLRRAGRPLLGEHSLWLEHGDLIDPRSPFQRALCRTVRHPIVRSLARRIHPDTAWSIGMWYGRKTEEYTEPLPKRF